MHLRAYATSQKPVNACLSYIFDNAGKHLLVVIFSDPKCLWKFQMFLTCLWMSVKLLGVKDIKKCFKIAAICFVLLRMILQSVFWRQEQLLQSCKITCSDFSWIFLMNFQSKHKRHKIPHVFSTLSFKFYSSINHIRQILQGSLLMNILCHTITWLFWHKFLSFCISCAWWSQIFADKWAILPEQILGCQPELPISTVRGRKQNNVIWIRRRQKK